MIKIWQNNRTFIISALIITGLTIFSRCISDQNKNNQQHEAGLNNIDDTVTFDQFAGSQTCAGCHKTITENYFNSFHFYTSQTASAQTIKGSFIPGKNGFQYDAGKIVKLEKRNDSFYQVYYHNNKEVVSRRFDIVIGSGKNGQTYLSWIGNHIIELPVSYFTQVGQWVNSPGYPLSPIIFNRPVTTRCLECHSTYAEAVNYNPDVPPAFDSTKMLLTVGCERCHGPAAKHVAYQTGHPKDTAGRYIINPGKLSTSLSLDVCGVCHAGRLEAKRNPFQFVAGDSLNHYYTISDAARNAGLMDVHGNQLGVLSASKCFQLSKTMTCVTCHDPHKNEAGNTVLFSQRCMSCHTDQHKPVEGISNTVVKNNCINCHMPLQESTSISFILQNKQTADAKMRTHYIAIYDSEIKNFIEENSTSKKKKL